MKSLRRLAVGFCFAAASLTLAGCDGAGKTTGIVEENDTFTIELNQKELTIGIGNTVALQAAVRDGSGRSLSDRQIFWSSSNSDIARVSSSGVVTALSEGKVQIAATHGGKSAVANLTVAPRSVASVVISPSQPGVLVGGTTQLTARTLDATGAELQDREVSWSSTNTAVALVDESGAVTGVSEGLSTIIATSEGRTASVGITVSPVPVASVALAPLKDTIVVAQTTQLTAEPRDESGVSLNGRPVEWSSSNVAVASVSSNGLVLAIAPGKVFITASSGGKSAEAEIVVQPRPVSSVIVSPSQPLITVGQSVTLTVQVTDENGTLLTGRPVSFQSNNASVAQVSSSGVVTGMSVGATAVIVTSEGKSTEVPVTVVPVAVATVQLNPSTADLIIGGTTKLAATLRDGAGNVLTGRTVAWSSGSPNVATVSSDGTITAMTPGTAVIIASSEGRIGTATITVRTVPVASVVVDPATSTVIIGDALDLTFSARDNAGNVLTGRTAFWTSSNETVAAVSSTGRVVGIAPGTTQITASVEGVTGSSTITVIVEPVMSISVQPTSISLHPTKTAQITATPRGRTGQTLDRPVSFTSASVATATVSNTGVVTAVKVGTTNINVTSEGRTVSVPVTITPPPVATVAVSLASSAITIGKTTQASAVLRDADGNVLTGRAIAWTTSNAAVATVTSAGVVTAVAPGTAEIKATSEGKSAVANVTVSLAPVAQVEVALTPSSVFVGQPSQAAAILRDADGVVLTGRTVTWSSSNQSVATVNASGAITALAQGSATITATSEGKSGSASLTVANVPVATVTVTLGSSSLMTGQQTQATAVLRDGSGNVLTGRDIIWQSSNPLVAVVSSTGVVTALLPGATQISATSEGKSGSALLNVSLVPVANVTVALQPASVTAGQPSKATATLRDANGNVLTGRPITWSSSNTDVAVVDAEGDIVTRTAGTASITAVSEGISGASTLTVANVPVSAVTVTLASSTLAMGQQTQATAVLRDANGNVLEGRAITWQSSNSLVASVSESGVVTALLPGAAQISATSEGKSGSALINVTLIPINSIVVTLNPTSVVVGQTSQATAVARDVFGNVLDRPLTWSSSDPSVAIVSATGLVTTLSAGSATITASGGQKSGSAILTVTNAPVATVAVALNPASVTVGQTSNATATLRDASDNVLTGRAVTWSSSNTDVATVDANGDITTKAAGSASITATSEGKSGSATLTVSNVPVATVAVTLGSSSLSPGQTTSATAVLRDGDGNVLTGRAVVWQSSNPQVATVSAAGIVTALEAGATQISATSEGKSGSALLTVTEVAVATVSVALEPSNVVVGQPAQATATLRDAGSNVLSGRVVTWSSSNTDVATVDASGSITSKAAGTTDITATSEGKSGSATLTVSAPPVATVTVTLASASVTVGEATTATAVLRDANNNVLSGRDIFWQSSNPAVATVSQNGEITTIGEGATLISASSEGKSGSATLTVHAAPVAVATVTVSLNPSTVEQGKTSQATATLRDSDGNVLNGRVVTWSSSNNDIATVNSAGVVSTKQEGTVTITATSEGKSGGAVLTITPVPVASVTVNLSSSSIGIGQTTQATATVRDAGDNVLAGRTISWSSSNTNVATVDDDGTVTAVGEGNASITATSEGVSGSAVITTTPPAVASITIELTPPSVVEGGTSTATATLRDANGNILTGRTVTWMSSDNSIATIDQNGTVTTLRSGTVTITATSEGKTGTAQLVVSLAAVARVEITPNTATVSRAGPMSERRVQLVAAAYDANNRKLIGRTFAWETDKVHVALVSNNGLVEGISDGNATITARTGGRSGTAEITVVRRL